MVFIGIASVVFGSYVALLLGFRILLRDIDSGNEIVKRHAFTAAACAWFTLDPSTYWWLRYSMEIIAVVNAFSCYYMVINGGTFEPVSLDGKVAIVTGANSGIGLETARQLVKMGAHVIFACRSQERALAAMEDVMKSTGSTKVQFIPLDLGDSKSIQAFPDAFRKTKLPLDILVNNAGVNYYKREVTVDGHERIFGTNHLGPFLLTNLLLPTILKSSEPRIVNVGSCMMKTASSGIPFDDLMSKKNYGDGIATYSWSKLANYYFTLELHRRYAEKNLKVNCVHPGLVISNLQENMHPVLKALAKWLYFLRPLLQQTGEQGARTSVYAAITPSLTSGNYLERCEVVEPSAELVNENAAKRLWDISCNLTNFKK